MAAAPHQPAPGLKPRRRVPLFVWVGACLVAGLAGAAAILPLGVSADRGRRGPEVLDAKRAYEYLVRICQLGPRPSGSAAMTKQQELLSEHFTGLGGKVRLQPFDAPHPLTGEPVRMANLIVSWHPEAKERVLLACHYDTRPYPDRDPYNPRGIFLGANDGASGVALLMELGHHLPSLRPTYGVDMVFFDGEELIFGDHGTYFLGSEHFAKDYRDHPLQHRYLYGVLVDMIGDRHLNIFKESNSVRYAPELTDSLWTTARRMGIREFDPREKYAVQDDHLPLNEIARIPTCDIIDFDYPYWHTTQDTPARCSGASLAKVGHVLLEWLENVPRPEGDGATR